MPISCLGEKKSGRVVLLLTHAGRLLRSLQMAMLLLALLLLVLSVLLVLPLFDSATAAFAASDFAAPVAAAASADTQVCNFKTLPCALNLHTERFEGTHKAICKHTRDKTRP